MNFSNQFTWKIFANHYLLNFNDMIGNDNGRWKNDGCDEKIRNYR